MGEGELEARRPPGTAVRFGEFRLDPARAEFTRSGQPVALRPKTFSLLALFVASPGRVLAKDELLAALWPKAVVTEGSLTQCVTELRAALGDSGEELIRTVPRQGYRFDAEVLAEPAAAAGWDKPSIAVLPFENLSGDPEQEYFADGMVDELITALSRIRWLVVIARGSSFTYKGKTVDVKRVGRELGVRYVLQGSVRKAGNNLRFFGQLVDATTGIQIWADRFEGRLEDIFDLHDRITSSVGGAVMPKLQQIEIERAKRKPTESLDAYDYYLRGLARIKFENRNHMAEALRLFLRAIDLDAEFAPAYAMATWCYAAFKVNGWVADAVNVETETARLARRAFELGRDDAFVLAASGWAFAYVLRDLDTGTELLDRALTLNPNMAIGWYWSGWLRIWRGDPGEAVARVARAMRLNPLNPFQFAIHSLMAHVHFHAGRYEDAIARAGMALQTVPDLLPGLRIHAASSAFAGRLEEARKSTARLRELQPTLRVSNLREILGPYRRPEDVAKYEEGLRNAGLPE